MKLLSIGMFFLMLSACGRNETNPPTDSANITSSALPSPETPRVLVKEDGWQIPGLKGGYPAKRTEHKGGYAPNMFVTKYVPGYSKGKPPVLGQSFFSDEDRQALRFFSSKTGDLVVKDVWVYDIGGRKFCYVLSVHPPGIGATMLLQFYDLDGDERFESVRNPNAFSPDLLPNWAK